MVYNYPAVVSINQSVIDNPYPFDPPSYYIPAKYERYI